MKKIAFLLLSAFVLAACGDSEKNVAATLKINERATVEKNSANKVADRSMADEGKPEEKENKEGIEEETLSAKEIKRAYEKIYEKVKEDIAAATTVDDIKFAQAEFEKMRNEFLVTTASSASSMKRTDNSKYEKMHADIVEMEKELCMYARDRIVELGYK